MMISISDDYFNLCKGWYDGYFTKSHEACNKFYNLINGVIDELTSIVSPYPHLALSIYDNMSWYVKNGLFHYPLIDDENLCYNFSILIKMIDDWGCLAKELTKIDFTIKFDDNLNMVEAQFSGDTDTIATNDIAKTLKLKILNYIEENKEEISTMDQALNRKRHVTNSDNIDTLQFSECAIHYKTKTAVIQKLDTHTFRIHTTYDDDISLLDNRIISGKTAIEFIYKMIKTAVSKFEVIIEK